MSGNTFIQDIRTKAAAKRLRVAFPDAEDVRTIQAALTLEAEKIAVPVLVGKSEAIRKIAGDDRAGILRLAIRWARCYLFQAENLCK